MASTNETAIHGGTNDTETVTQKHIAHQTSTIRKTIVQSRPPINQAEVIARTLLPKQ